jgi:hypothetical protein
MVAQLDSADSLDPALTSAPGRSFFPNRALPDRARIGLAALMEAQTDFERFVPAGLATLGIEADEVDLAVMRAAHQLYWPAMSALLEVDLSGVEPEMRADLSRAPEPS